MNAELTYLFRHVLLRDAAYQLQLPADLARLHMLSLRIIEDLCVKKGDVGSLNEYSAELAYHAGRARELTGDDADISKPAAELEVKYLARAAIYAYERFQLQAAFPMIERFASLAAAPLRQRVAVLMRGCDMALDLAQYQRALEIAQRARTMAETEKPDIRGGAARLYGLSLHRLGRLQEAEAAFRSTLEMCRAEKDTVGIARSLERLGMLLVDTGGLAEAESCYLEALEIHTSTGDAVALGGARSNYAVVLNAQGRVADAIKVAQDALARHRENRHPRFEGVTLGLLSRLHFVAGDKATSEALFEEAVAIDQRTQTHDALVSLYSERAALLRKAGNLAGAYDLLARALRIHDSCGNRQAMFSMLLDVAGIQQELGRREDEEKTLLLAQSLNGDLGQGNVSTGISQRLAALRAQG